MVICDDLMNMKIFRSLSRYCDPTRVKQTPVHCGQKGSTAVLRNAIAGQREN